MHHPLSPSSLFKNVDEENTIRLRGIQWLWRNSMNHPGIDVYHAARWHLKLFRPEPPTSLVVEITGRQAFGCYILCRCYQMTAGDNSKTLISSGKSIGIV